MHFLQVFAVVLVVLPVAINGLSAAPGAQIRLNSAGLNKAVQSLVTYIDAAFADETVGDVSGADGKIHYEISDIKFHLNVDPTKTVFQTNPDNTLSLTTEAVAGTVSFHYHLKIHEIVHISKSGNCDASVDGSSFSISLRIGDSNGAPSLVLVDDSVSIKDLKYKCHGDLIDDLLDLLHKVLTPTITKHLDEYVDKTIKDKLPEIAAKIANIQTEHGLGGRLSGFFVDYGLSASPALTSEQLIVPLVAQFYYQGHKNDNPASVYPSKRPFPTTASSELFCTNLDTDLVFKSLTYAFNVSGATVFKVDENLLQKLDKKSQEFFSCDCQTGQCLIQLLPQFQSSCAAGKSFSIEGQIHIGGDLSGSSNGLVAYASGAGNFTVGDLSVDLFTIDADVSVLLEQTVRVENGSLYGKIDIFETKLSASTALGPIAPDVLQKIWQFGLQDVAQFLANDFLSAGIPLPKLDFMTFTNVQISFVGPLVQVCSDVEIDFSHLI